MIAWPTNEHETVRAARVIELAYSLENILRTCPQAEAAE